MLPAFCGNSFGSVCAKTFAGLAVSPTMRSTGDEYALVTCGALGLTRGTLVVRTALVLATGVTALRTAPGGTMLWLMVVLPSGSLGTAVNAVVVHARDGC